MRFPKTHDLTALLNLVLELGDECESLRHHLNGLTDIGIEVRYRGVTADKDDAALAMTAAEETRRMVGASLSI